MHFPVLQQPVGAQCAQDLAFDGIVARFKAFLGGLGEVKRILRPDQPIIHPIIAILQQLGKPGLFFDKGLFLGEELLLIHFAGEPQFQQRIQLFNALVVGFTLLVKDVCPDLGFFAVFIFQFLNSPVTKILRDLDILKLGFRLLLQFRADTRSTLIEQDISDALKQGRRCLVLSQWNEHCQALADKLTQKGTTPFVLSGTQGKKERAAILKSIQDTPQDKNLIVVATGQYLGEGFDCPQLDTLFLAFPVSFKGKLIQYVGRIMREHPSKKRVLVYDYRDSQVPVLNKMYANRMKTYKTMGFIPDKQKEMLL